MSKAVRIVLMVGFFVLVNLGLRVLAQTHSTPTADQLRSTLEAKIPAKTLTGVVVDSKGPVPGATVRIQATDKQATTTEDGSFTFTVIDGTWPLTLTAWAEGYYIGWAPVHAKATPITITLNAHYMTDNHQYEWFREGDVEGSQACGACHTAYPEWQADAHSQAAVNPRFLTMYQGTDVHGNQSPAIVQNNLGIPLPPDLTKPYFGPGFKLDFPNRPGSCATCHTPLAGRIANAQNCAWSGCHNDSTAQRARQILDPGVSPVGLRGDATEGISCEFCHKVGQVFLKGDTNLPYPDMPGILSVKLFRPQAGHDLFFGPLDDIARSDVATPRDVYLPLMKESAFCAGCHYGVLGGVVVGDMNVKGGVLIYSSYEEWLNSPWSEPETGKTCQECHMPPVAEAEYFVFPEKGGVRRAPDQIHNHKMLGATDEEFLRNAVTLTATARLKDGQLAVEVSVTNDQTGHHVPTDSPLRHVMLVVQATGADGEPLPLLQGSALPDWAGNYAGQPGRAFAKILQDEWTGELPSGAIWRPVKIVEDTRLAAFATDVSQYQFAASAQEATTVEVRLIYRRAFQQLMAWKGWTDSDMVMAQETLDVKAR